MNRFCVCKESLVRGIRSHNRGTITGLWATLLLFAGFMLSIAASAQSDRGAITGTVTDTLGAVVPKVAIQVTNLDTGVQVKVGSTSTGKYDATSLPAGTYKIEASSRGFKSFIQTGITVSVAETDQVNIVLTVGSVSETITVTGDATLLKTANAEQNTTVDRQTLNDLPLPFATTGAMRDPMGFSKLAPGTYVAPGSNTGIRVNGLPMASFHIAIDGMDSTNANLNDREDGDHPSVDMLQEFTLQSSNFSAEFGQVSGGMFNFTARSGTNVFHGSAYENFVNEDLNAGIPYSNATTASTTNPGFAEGGPNNRPKIRQNDYGFSVGGPVRIPWLYNGHDKTFFFFNYEQWRKTSTTQCPGCAVPTDHMRAGNFSDILGTTQLATDILGRPVYQNEIYNPATARTVAVAGKNYVVTDPFPNNTINTPLSSVASKVQSLVPATTVAGTTVATNNYYPLFAYPLLDTVPAFKIDHAISQNWKASFYYSDYITNTPNSVDDLPYPISGERATASHADTFRLNNDYAVTPNLLVHAGVGYTRDVNPDSSPASVYDYDNTQLGIPNLVGRGFPHFGGISTSYGGLVNGSNGGGLGPTQINRYWMDHANGVASAIWTHGNHAIKGGAEYKLDMWIVKSQINQSGGFNFSGAETALPYNNSTTFSTPGGASGTVGFPYASFLLGLVDSGTIGNAIINQYHRPTWALYLQDTWKVTPRLTVDYGIRWDLTQTTHEHGFHTSGFSPTAVNENAVGPSGPLLGGMEFEGFGTGRCNCYFMPYNPYNLGPRLGVSYQVTSKTVLRGGFGITYGQAFPFDYAGSNFSVVSVGYNTLNFSSQSFGTPNTTLTNGFQYIPSAITSAALDPGVSCCTSINNSPSPYFDPHGDSAPRIYNYTVSLQQELTGNLVVEASWVGNRADRLISGDQGNSGLVQLNALSQQRLASFGLDPTNPADAFALISKFSSGVPQSRGFSLPYATFPTSQTLAQALRPYPQYGTIYSEYSPTGKSWYDAAQVKVTKRISHGLEFLDSFTWSKELEEGTDTERGRGAQINDALNRASNKFFTSTYAPFINVTSATYQVPNLPFSFVQKNWVGRELLGGWTLGGIFRFANGQLMRVPGSNIATNLCSSATTCTAYPLSGLLERSTWANLVPGVPLFKFNPNSHNFGSTIGRAQGTTFLNAAAWVEPALGKFATTAPYLNNYRWQRQPDEEMNIGKKFSIPMGKHEPASLQVRAEFFNIFNHTYLPTPSSGNFETPDSTATVGTQSYLSSTGGFGRDNAATIGNESTQYRTGQLVARFQF
jgi:hypothetical protein